VIAIAAAERTRPIVPEPAPSLQRWKVVAGALLLVSRKGRVLSRAAQAFLDAVTDLPLLS
jgi:hypothetical protein